MITMALLGLIGVILFFIGKLSIILVMSLLLGSKSIYYFFRCSIFYINTYKPIRRRNLMIILLIILLVVLIPILLFLFGAVAVLFGALLTYLIPFLVAIIFLGIVFS